MTVWATRDADRCGASGGSCRLMPTDGGGTSSGFRKLSIRELLYWSWYLCTNRLVGLG